MKIKCGRKLAATVRKRRRRKKSSIDWEMRISRLNISIFLYFKTTAKDLIQHLLTVDPKTRYKVEDIFKHPWMKNVQRINGTDGNTTNTTGSNTPSDLPQQDETSNEEISSDNNKKRKPTSGNESTSASQQRSGGEEQQSAEKKHKKN